MMRRNTGNTLAALAVIVLPGVSNAQSSPAPVPFVVGEELVYKASYGRIPAGTARMRVDCIERVRGRPAYHLIFSIDGGIPFFRVHDRYESWVDTATHASLRFAQSIHEGGYKKERTYEIYPERAVYQENGDSAAASVANPLDDGSFIYAVRRAGVRVGETQRFDRYFKPDRNPVVLTGLRSETLNVEAGRYATTVIRPSIKANGIFSEDGDAQVWLSDDINRYPVQVKSKFSKFSLTLELQSVKAGDRVAQTAMIAEVLAAR